MIHNLVQNGEYKKYRTVTLIKDFMLVWGALAGVALLIGLGISFITWTDWIITISYNELFGMYFRGSYILAFIIAVFVNVRSHQLEIHKMNK